MTHLYSQYIALSQLYKQVTSQSSSTVFDQVHFTKIHTSWIQGVYQYDHRVTGLRGVTPPPLGKTASYDADKNIDTGR
jgi:hypothetical protein